MSLLNRLSNLFRRSQLRREIDEELQFHIDARTLDNIAKGMAPGEARMDATRRFGNQTLSKEETREMDIITWVETFGQDVRYGLRQLRRSPGFTAVAVLTLALGIGANTAIFSIVNSVLLRPLALREPERLVKINFDNPGAGLRNVRFSAPELDDLKGRAGIFEDVSVTWPVSLNLTGAEHPERLELLAVSPNYFSMLGVIPQKGRVFGEQDSAPGFAEGIVISDGLWHRSFGGDSNILGRNLRLDNDLYTIVGVLPPGFRHPGKTIANDVEVWATAGYSADPFPKPARNARFLPGAIGRLKAGVSLQQAQARLDALSDELRSEYPNDYPAQARWAINLEPLQQSLVGKVQPCCLSC